MVDPAHSLTIVVCRYLMRETETILGEEGFQDVAARAFAPTCIHPQRAETLLSQVQALQLGNTHSALLVGGCLLRNKAQLEAAPPGCDVCHQEQCHYFLASKELVDAIVRKGAYLLSPGWLANWRQRISQWGFDQETARAFFHESVTELVLLDTALDALSEETLREFAEFLALPFRIVPVGLGHFRLALKEVVLEWRLKQVQGAADRANRDSADYSMRFDLLIRLARVTAEQDAVEQIMEVFELLFAAQEMVYASMRGEEIVKAYTRNALPPEPGAYRSWLSQRQQSGQCLPEQNGFYLRLTEEDRTLGILDISNTLMPERCPEYLEVARSLSAICELVISNARMHSEIQQLSVTDPLTGISNRRSFFDLGQKEFVRARRYGRPLSVVMMDIDHFKSVNDTHGHQAGDRVLVEVARRCRQSLRASDLCARYGGEEVVMLLPETALQGATEAAGRLRACVADKPVDLTDNTIAVTVSLGVSALQADDGNIDALIARSDQALYAAKREGRNRVCSQT